MAGEPLDPFGMGLLPAPAPAIPPIAPIPPINQIGSIGDIATIAPVEARPSPVRTRSKPMQGPDHLLRPVDSTDNMVFRGAIRQALDITPLIDGVEAYYEMEQAIMDAKSSVLLAFWLFDPETPLLHDDTSTWGKLLVEAAKRGLKICLLTSDRDPGFDLFGHAWAWLRYFAMFQASGTLPLGRVELVCARHEAEVPVDTVKLVRATLYDDVVKEFNDITDAGQRATMWQNVPGLWDKMDFDPGTSKIKRKKPGEHYPVYPATHHNKVIIVDGKLAFAGGMNIAPSYKDSILHDRLTQAWHDAFVKVEGREILTDFLRCYAGLWNQERVRCEKFLTDAYSARGVTLRLSKTSDLDPAKLLAPAAGGATPQIPSQVHRTVTKKGTATSGVPDIVRQDILDGYLKAIGKAEKFIYIENQYVREQEMIDAIIQRAKAATDLRVILLMPKVAEEFKDKSKIDAVNLYGAALQYELIEKAKKALKNRLGLFALLKKDGQDVYVHSKLIIVDDVYASIGSANTNPRGFKMDSELDFAWFEPKVTQQLRLGLWNEVLGNPGTLNSWKPKEYVEKWNAIAKKNSGRSGVKQGFVVFFENKEQGNKMPLVDLGPFT